jgi:hypothetical protein
MGGDDDDYIPSVGALEFVEQVDRLDACFAPLPSGYYRQPLPKKKPPKKKKQLKLKQAVKNMTKPPVNFQGAPLDKCTVIPELDNKPVFIHGNYEKAWRKCQKQSFYIASSKDKKCCPDCFLRPCSAILLEHQMEVDSCTVTELARMSEEEHREKLRRYYRAQMTKLQGKRFILRQMPNNESIPSCAKTATAKIARIEAGGYDSLCDDKNGTYPFRVTTKKSKFEELLTQPSPGEESEEEWDGHFGDDGLIQTQPL